MSVVAVKVNKNNIEIASDSIIVKGSSKRTNGGFHKLTEINGMVIGAVGDAEEASLFMNFCVYHNIKSATTEGVLDFMCEFLEWKLRYPEMPCSYNEYIIVVDGHAFSVCGLLVEEITNYDAIGAGEDFAMASLYLGHTARDSVKVACDLCCYVAEPIVTMTVKK